MKCYVILNVSKIFPNKKFLSVGKYECVSAVLVSFTRAHRVTTNAAVGVVNAHLNTKSFRF